MTLHFTTGLILLACLVFLKYRGSLTWPGLLVAFAAGYLLGDTQLGQIIVNPVISVCQALGAGIQSLYDSLAVMAGK